MFLSIQSIPGLIFARSDVKAKIQPGVEASIDTYSASGELEQNMLSFQQQSQRYRLLVKWVSSAHYYTHAEVLFIANLFIATISHVSCGQ